MNQTISTEGNPVIRVTAAPGEAVVLPAGKTLRVRAVSGTAYITHTGRDLFLWRGDVERLVAVNVRIWGAPVLSALGKHPATVMIEMERMGSAWQSWIEKRRERVSGAMKVFWTRWRAKSADRQTTANRPHRWSGC